jgi:hypothetical protein
MQMSKSTDKKCPDCAAAINEIRIIDKAGHLGGHTGCDFMIK